MGFPSNGRRTSNVFDSGFDVVHNASIAFGYLEHLKTPNGWDSDKRDFRDD
jgi:hypothetical protein